MNLALSRNAGTRRQRRTVGIGLLMLFALGCSDPNRSALAAAAQSDAGPDGAAAPDFKQTDNPASILMSDAGAMPDAGRAREAGPALDAFFINDPAPPMCGPNGMTSEPKPVGGTPDCPGDKNREGCACTQPGEKAACWPGQRLNRGKGTCKDGMTTCELSTEFGPSWGPCKGYVLPVEGATQGPDACRCFSNGKWALNNLVPCVYQTAQQVYLYSSHPDATKGFECSPVSMSPPPMPTADWNSSTLSGDCAGQFKLCYTMKAGLVASPKPDDCVVMSSCVDIWYAQPGQEQALQNLPGWSSSDAACAKKFIELGGYGEMSVLGKSVECDAVDDGHGRPYVFKRTSYCLPTCSMTPERPECMGCSTGGSGQF
jgi:hypothetical protein